MIQGHYTTTFRAAQILGISVAGIQSLFDRQVLSGWKTPGGHRRILSESLDNYMKKNCILSNINTKKSILILDKEFEKYKALAIKFSFAKIYYTETFTQAISQLIQFKPSIFIIPNFGITPVDKNMLSKLLEAKEFNHIYLIILSDQCNSNAEEHQNFILAQKPFNTWLDGFISCALNIDR